ncbi:MAG: SET domain-containing protein-lysine N-methyltransferase [Bacteroidetes bacterium]|nr:SET domain-containing protein-lysine N-methyltransferase [Bacteroidota bacterium]
MISCALYIDHIAGKGRGIFAGENIPMGTIVETSPVIVMTAEERLLLDKTLLHDYIFEWKPDGQALCCMAQGYISVYNHSYTSNCEYFMDYENETITIKTVREIELGEELTINYNGDWDDATPVWFDVF